MTKDERNMAIGAGAIAAALLGFGWYAFADGDEAKPEPEPGPKPGPRPSDSSLCDLDGRPYDVDTFDSPAAVVNALQGLGYNITSVTTPGGRLQVQAFQVRARELGLRGYQGAPQSYIDSIVGACTLRSVAHAQELEAEGNWPEPYEPI